MAAQSTNVKLTLPVGLKRYLDELVKTGVYGASPSEAAAMLVRDGIKSELSGGLLDEVK